MLQALKTYWSELVYFFYISGEQFEKWAYIVWVMIHITYSREQFVFVDFVHKSIRVLGLVACGLMDVWELIMKVELIFELSLGLGDI